MRVVSLSTFLMPTIPELRVLAVASTLVMSQPKGSESALKMRPPRWSMVIFTELKSTLFTYELSRSPSLVLQKNVWLMFPNVKAVMAASSSYTKSLSELRHEVHKTALAKSITIENMFLFIILSSLFLGANLVRIPQIAVVLSFYYAN